MVTGAYWPELSGGGLQCRTMIEALKEQFRFRVFTTCTDPSLARDGSVDGVPVTRAYVDLSRRSTKLAAVFQTIWFFIRHHASFDIVHLHGFSQKSVLIVLLAKLTRKKIVLTIHTAGHDEAAAVKGRGGLAYWAYRQADLYIAISARMAANYLAAGLPQARLRTISNGVDTRRFHPASPAERAAARIALGNLSPDLRWILFVGFFSREKAPDVLFNAWLAMRDSAPPSGLLFVGAVDSAYSEVDPKLAAEMTERAASQGLSSHVRFTGPLASVEQAYHAADVFVMPSTREAFGMVLVEAMASGLPVIASRIDGVTDQMVADGRTGILVAPGGVQELADAIRETVNSRDAAVAMGSRAREAVEAHFGIEAVRQHWSAAYESLL